MHFKIFDCISKYVIYNFYYLFIETKVKMRYIKFLLKPITICLEKKARFDNKNNYKYSKLANFWLVIFS